MSIHSIILKIHFGMLVTDQPIDLSLSANPYKICYSRYFLAFTNLCKALLKYLLTKGLNR